MPNVSGDTAEGQVKQLVSFLRQLVQELNYVVGKLERDQQEGKH